MKVIKLTDEQHDLMVKIIETIVDMTVADMHKNDNHIEAAAAYMQIKLIQLKVVNAEDVA